MPPALVGKWHLGSTPETVPNAHGFDRFLGFHSGCIDFFSHRYYWGEPRTVNYHDLWRDRTEIFEDGQYTTELFAPRGRAVHPRQSQPPVLPVPAIQRACTIRCMRRASTWSVSATWIRSGTCTRRCSRRSTTPWARCSALRELRLLDNTLVFFTGDNGATREQRAGLNQKPATAGNNQPFRGNKFSAFDGGMHVPMIMNWPGVIPKGQVLTQSAAMWTCCPPSARRPAWRFPRTARWMASMRCRWPCPARSRLMKPSSGPRADRRPYGAAIGSW